MHVRRTHGYPHVGARDERVVFETSRVRTTVELLVALVAVAGVAVGVQQANEIGQQLKQQVAIEQGATDRELLSAIRDIDAMFVDAPKLRPYFYGGIPLPGARLERARVLAAAERLLDTADAVASARRHGLLSSEDWADWRAAFHSYYDESPALRIVWRDYAYFYSDETRQLLTDRARSKAGA